MREIGLYTYLSSHIRSRGRSHIVRLPIDTGTMTFMVARPPEAVRDFETRRPRIDQQTGEPLYTVALFAFTDGDAEIIPVRVPGDPGELPQGSHVRVVSLHANPWAKGDRSGVSYRATRIEAARAEPPTTGRPAARSS
jgi:hypothetical protein